MESVTVSTKVCVNCLTIVAVEFKTTILRWNHETWVCHLCVQDMEWAQ